MKRIKIPGKLPKDYTQFQRKVFNIVCKIPIGQTKSYKWVAEKVGSPKAQRAVGQTLKKNPLPLIIPCHRVIRSDGFPGGYVFGEKVKNKLLALEKSLAKKL